MLRKIIYLSAIFAAFPFLSQAQTNYKWRVGFEEVAQSVRKSPPYPTVGIGVNAERYIKTKNLIKYHVGASFLQVYGYSTRLSNPLYEAYFLKVYESASREVFKDVDVSLATGVSNTGIFICPGFAGTWKRFYFHCGYRVFPVTFKDAKFYAFSDHVKVGISYSFGKIKE